MTWDFIDATFRERPELAQAVKSVQRSQKGGFIYETDLSHLPEHLKSHISQIKDLTNSLLVIASDESLDEHLRQESHEVLEQVLHHLTISREQFRAAHDDPRTSQLFDREVNHIVSIAQEILEDMEPSTRPRNKRGREREGASVTSPVPQKRVQRAQDLKRFTKACEKLTSEYSFNKDTIPIGRAVEYLDSLISKTIGQYSHTVSPHIIEQKGAELVAFADAQNQEIAILLSKIYGLKVSEATQKAILALPIGKVKLLLESLSVIENGYVRDLQKQIGTSEPIPFIHGIPVTTRKFLEGAFSYEGGEEKKLFQQIVEERLPRCIESVFRNAFSTDSSLIVRMGMEADRPTVSLAASVNPLAAQYVPDYLKRDVSLLMPIVEQYPWILGLLGEAAKSNILLITKAIEKFPWVISLVSEQMRDTKDLMQIAVQKDGSLLRYASPRLQQDPTLLELARQSHPPLPEAALHQSNLQPFVSFLQRVEGKHGRCRVQMGSSHVFYEVKQQANGSRIIVQPWSFEEAEKKGFFSSFISMITSSFQRKQEEPVLDNAFCIHLAPDGTIACITQGSSLVDQQTAEELLGCLQKKMSSEEHPEPIDQLGLRKEDLLTFRAATIAQQKVPQPGTSSEPHEILIGEPPTKYMVWMHGLPEGVAINIQDEDSYNRGAIENKFGIQINEEGEVISIYVNDQRVSELDERQKEILTTCFAKSLKDSSIYQLYDSSSIDIKTVMRSPKQIPLFHIQQLAQSLGTLSTQEHQQFPQIHVIYTLDNLTDAPGIDAGGLRRSYLDDMFQGLAETSEFASRSEKSNLFTPIPFAGHEDTYQQIGQICMWCYLQRPPTEYWDTSLIIGDHFNPAFFAAALSLSSDQINQEPMSDETKATLRRVIIQAAAQHNLDSPLGHMHVLSNIDQWIETFAPTEANLATLTLIVQMTSLDENYEPVPGTITDTQKLASILQKPHTARTAEENQIIEQFLSQAHTFADTNLDAQILELFSNLKIDLEAIRAVARGMRSFTLQHPGRPQWDDVRKTPYLDFRTKVQGTKDREKVARSIHCSDTAPESLRQKVQFVQEWIRDPSTTTEEIDQFLKWVTGSTATPERGITFGGSYRMAAAIPFVHTCSSSLEICDYPYGLDEGFPYDTKEGFLHYLKAGMASGTSFDFA